MFIARRFNQLAGSFHGFFNRGATRKQLNLALIAGIAMAAMATGQNVTAFTTPASGSLGYDVYTTTINLLTGPIGFVSAIFLIVWGASQVMKAWPMTVMCVIAGTVVIKAQTIVTSLGAMLPVQHVDSLASVAKVVGIG